MGCRIALFQFLTKDVDDALRSERSCLANLNDVELFKFFEVNLVADDNTSALRISFSNGGVKRRKSRRVAQDPVKQVIESQIPRHHNAGAVCFDAVAFHRLDKKSLLGDVWNFGGQVSQEVADAHHTVVNPVLGIQGGPRRPFELVTAFYLYKIRRL